LLSLINEYGMMRELVKVLSFGALLEIDTVLAEEEKEIKEEKAKEIIRKTREEINREMKKRKGIYDPEVLG